MGACDFYTQAEGKTADSAFNSAVDRAQWEHGHGGYSGTIAEKGSFQEFTVPSLPDGVSITTFAEACMESAYDETPTEFSCGRQIDNKWERFTVPVPESLKSLMKQIGEVADDKWGDAVCFKVRDNLYLFFGMASC